jgi:hypothetical protein
MTRQSVRTTRVLCVVGVLAIAGCAHRGTPSPAPTSAAVPVGISTTAPAATPTPDAAVDQQVSSIDDQLNTINGQLNAANAGLNSSEGNPAQ